MIIFILWLLEKGNFFHSTCQFINKFVKILGIKILVFDLDFGFTHQCISKIVSCCIAFYKYNIYLSLRLTLCAIGIFSIQISKTFFSFDERFLTIWNYFSRMMKIYSIEYLLCKNVLIERICIEVLYDWKIPIYLFHVKSQSIIAFANLWNTTF